MSFVSFVSYRDAFLLGLALYWEVGAPSFDLTAEQSAAAFAVAGVLGGKINANSIVSQLDHNANDGETSMRTALAGDKSEIPMPDTFVAAWDRVKSPVSHETRKTILDGVPLVKGIPELAPDNNHRKDKEHAMDKLHRSCEKSCYEVLQLLANVEHVQGKMGEDQGLDPQYMLHCAIYLLGDLAHHIHDQREKKSIPGGCGPRECFIL